MTQDEIIELARQAGMEQDLDMWFSPSYEQCDVHILELERFAKLVAEKEKKRIIQSLYILHQESDEFFLSTIIEHIQDIGEA